MNYAHKQKKAKLDNWYICSKLGIKLNDWKDTKAGRKRLANDKLDKFLEMTSNKNEWINQEQVKDEAYEWFEKTTLRECYKDFNTNQRNVAKDLGINPSAISIIESGKTDYTKSDVTILLYLYFQDDNNRRYGENKNKKKVGRPKKKPTLIFSKFFNSKEKEESSYAKAGKPSKDEDDVILTKEDLEITEALNEPPTPLPKSIVEEINDKAPTPTIEEFERLQQDNIGLMEHYKELQDKYESLTRNYRELKRELERYRYLIDLARPVDLSKPYYGFDNKE